MAMILRTADNRYQANWDASIAAGFTERQVNMSDAEVAWFPGEACARKSSASGSPTTYSNSYYGEYQVVFAWKAPITTKARLHNAQIFRMKLVNNTGTELANDTLIIWLLKKPHQPFGIPFAYSNYSPWRNLTIAQQRDITLNETCAIRFENPGGAEPPFVELDPGFELQIAYAGS
ncbi:MAG: hypothetical protein QXI19_10445, partial [Candidatus Caldarchaeum sp.]